MGRLPALWILVFLVGMTLGHAQEPRAGARNSKRVPPGKSAAAMGTNSKSGSAKTDTTKAEAAKPEQPQVDPNGDAAAKAAPDKPPADSAGSPPANSPASPETKPKYTDEEYHTKKSYVYGLDIARGIKADEMEFDLPSLIKGLTDGLAKDSKPTVTEQEYAELMLAIMAEAQYKAEEKHKRQSEENQKAAEKFLAENGKQEGVVALSSGLQYKVLKTGDGPAPTATDSVQLHLVGKLLSGQQFINTYSASQPSTLIVGRVLRGLREALLNMKKGDKWIVYIPPDLAFGSKGSQAALPGLPDVGPNELVIYEVELLEIEKEVKE
ncbi:MAG: FKBP-type peptidyl-prolyl cis-trans isomerase N-terminal domain-containing protein [Pirellulales bacterium]|nr:FKBP-type peptidyl-prolyl cis-trans isomerase N-terminal domain-containing protein [Pirellulales bacterium]